jgi:hypothetical protein
MAVSYSLTETEYFANLSHSSKIAASVFSSKFVSSRIAIRSIPDFAALANPSPGCRALVLSIQNPNSRSAVAYRSRPRLRFSLG